MSADYPLAQWFDPPRSCRICGKPAGALMSFRGNAVLAFMCKAHAEREIKAAHRRGDFAPDAVLAASLSSTPTAES